MKSRGVALTEHSRRKLRKCEYERIHSSFKKRSLEGVEVRKSWGGEWKVGCMGEAVFQGLQWL